MAQTYFLVNFVFCPFVYHIKLCLIYYALQVLLPMQPYLSYLTFISMEAVCLGLIKLYRRAHSSSQTDPFNFALKVHQIYAFNFKRYKLFF